MPGIFSSIDAYGKRLVHDFFDQHKALPDWFPDIGQVKSYVPGHRLHWSRFRIEHPETKIVLRGTPDDVFQVADGSHHVVDYKTAKATEKQDELFPMYLVQLNVYAFIGQDGILNPISALSLIYMEPQTDVAVDRIPDLTSKDGFSLKFKATLKSVELKAPTLIPELLCKAREIYDRANPPDGKESCRDCELLDRLLEIAQP